MLYYVLHMRLLDIAAEALEMARRHHELNVVSSALASLSKNAAAGRARKGCEAAVRCLSVGSAKRRCMEKIGLLQLRRGCKRQRARVAAAQRHLVLTKVTRHLYAWADLAASVREILEAKEMALEMKAVAAEHRASIRRTLRRWNSHMDFLLLRRHARECSDLLMVKVNEWLKETPT